MKDSYKFYRKDDQTLKYQEIIQSLENQEGNITKLLSKYRYPHQIDEEKATSHRMHNKQTNSKTINFHKQQQRRKPKTQRQIIREIKFPTLQTSITHDETKQKLNQQQSSGKKLEKRKKRNVEISSKLKAKKQSQKKEYLKKLIAKQSSFEATSKPQIVSQVNHVIPDPIEYHKAPQKNQIDSEQSEEGEVPFAFYEQKYAQKMKEQCREELNFLYWSKSTDTKEWAEELFDLFAKHDNELESMHKKLKVMEKFDDYFCGSELYKK